MFFVLTLFNFSLIQFLIPTNHAYTHIKIIILSFLFYLRSIAQYIYQFVYWLDFAFLKRGWFFYLLCTVVCLTTHVNPWSQMGDKNRLIHESNIDCRQWTVCRNWKKQPEMLKINQHLHQPTLELVSMSLLQYLGLLWIKFSHCYKRRIFFKNSLTSYKSYFILL